MSWYLVSFLLYLEKKYYLKGSAEDAQVVWEAVCVGECAGPRYGRSMEGKTRA